MHHLLSTAQAEVTLRWLVRSWGNSVLQLRALFSGGERESVVSNSFWVPDILFWLLINMIGS